jgi:hypothetical protein
MKEYEPPKASNADAGAAVARAVVQALPLGSSALALFDQAITPPLERRLHEWRCTVAEGLLAVEVKIEELGERQDLLDDLLHASQIAVRTSIVAKLDALRNAVINAALPGAPEAILRHMFIENVDRFHEWHLRLLTLFEDPVAYAKTRGVEFPSVLKWNFEKVVLTVFPELADQRLMYDVVWGDLHRAGLVLDPTLRSMSIEGEVPMPSLAPLGREFLAFIREPPKAST